MTFHISFDFALIILIAITGIYLVLGGYFAVTITDFIQGFIMLIGAWYGAVLVKNAGGLFCLLFVFKKIMCNMFL